ncbi:MAG: TetR/AcrR family transcriptional regulator [Actinomycetota bacterium]
MEETRRRIAKAGFELHATVGPSRASISAIADLAGVQRHTVYRHFPDMVSLIRACTEHGVRTTLPPDPERWVEIRDPILRLSTGLSEIYDFYHRNERLLANVWRDMQVMPELVEGADAFIQYMTRIREVLSKGWRARGRRRVLLLAEVGHAMEFTTWHSLTHAQGLEDAQAVEAMATMVRCLSERGSSS